MKIKMIKKNGWHCVAVDDEEMNKLYNCNQKQPILLAMLTEYTKDLWELKDFRLELGANGSANPYFEGTTIEKYKPKDEADANALKSKLRHYITKEDGTIVWSNFSGIVAYGDESNNPLLSEREKLTGAWSFSAGMTKLNEIREFWESYSDQDLEKIEIKNPNKQITSSEHLFERLLKSETIKKLIK